jgi:uncharacterized membrane protein YhiD involved in acid resistance
VIVGQGEYGLAILGTVAVLVVLAGFDALTRNIAPVIYRRLVVTGAHQELPSVSRRISELLTQSGCRVQDVSGHRDSGDAPFELVFHVRCRNALQAPEMLDKIAREHGVMHVEWSQISH